jgi:hypothetical protein
VNQHIATLTRSLNHAIALSCRENPLLPKSQYVRAILLTKGIPFYGFHFGYAPFLKVLVANPLVVKRAITLLQSGHVMKTKFRIFESHINFMLQFMCDFGRLSRMIAHEIELDIKSQNFMAVLSLRLGTPGFEETNLMVSTRMVMHRRLLLPVKHI